MSKVQKKNQMVSQASSRYDLDTGNKLFSPKTILNPKTAMSSKSTTNINSTKNDLNYFKRDSTNNR